MANLGYIQVVRRCNQRCRFCSNPVNERELPLAEARRLVDRYRRRGYDGVILTGGEPTLWEPLPELIAYAARRGVPCRVITNAQRTADPAYLDRLLAAGLEHVHVSVHSHRKAVQAFLTGNPESLANIVRTLARLGRRGATVAVNQTICAQNAGHLDQTARWLCERFPYLRHFSWTYLDPLVERVAEHPETVPTLTASGPALRRAMRWLARTGRTFRVEKVPLCHMGEFAHCATETRALVKGEQRSVEFLDERRFHREDEWRYGKGAACADCTLAAICAGLWDMGGRYDAAELVTQAKDPRRIARRVLAARD
ncbi:MAG: radical SAM protein [Elusimicrobia bacterium]|nr:radical SAM protein [Elusimicrobiota bacterium]